MNDKVSLTQELVRIILIHHAFLPRIWKGVERDDCSMNYFYFTNLMNDKNLTRLSFIGDKKNLCLVHMEYTVALLKKVGMGVPHPNFLRPESDVVLQLGIPSNAIEVCVCSVRSLGKPRPIRSSSRASDVVYGIYRGLPSGVRCHLKGK